MCSIFTRIKLFAIADNDEGAKKRKLLGTATVNDLLAINTSMRNFLYLKIKIYSLSLNGSRWSITQSNQRERPFLNYFFILI